MRHGDQIGQSLKFGKLTKPDNVISCSADGYYPGGFLVGVAALHVPAQCVLFVL